MTKIQFIIAIDMIVITITIQIIAITMIVVTCNMMVIAIKIVFTYSKNT